MSSRSVLGAGKDVEIVEKGARMKTHSKAMLEGIVQGL